MTEHEIKIIKESEIRPHLVKKAKTEPSPNGHRKQILREIPFKRAFEPLKEDVMILANTVAEMGETEDAKRIYTEALTGQYRGDTVISSDSFISMNVKKKSKPPEPAHILNWHMHSVQEILDAVIT